jgi:hypothetical protein
MTMCRARKADISGRIIKMNRSEPKSVVTDECMMKTGHNWPKGMGSSFQIIILHCSGIAQDIFRYMFYPDLHDLFSLFRQGRGGKRGLMMMVVEGGLLTMR